MDASNTPASGRLKRSQRGHGQPDSDAGLAVRIANRQERLAIEPARLRQAVIWVWNAERDGGTATRAEITVAIVDDATIAQLHERFLKDPTPTDVLTFVMEDTPRKLEADVVVSADTAIAAAEEYGWSAFDELVLYAIHGVLHLAGYDDTSPQRLAAMREAETRHLAHFGLTPKYGAQGAHAALPEAPAPPPRKAGQASIPHGEKRPRRRKRGRDG